MWKFIGKANEWIFCKLSKSEILRLYSIVHVAMETSKSFISIFFTCQVSACELQPFSCHDLANDIYSQTAKTVFSHLKGWFTEYNFVACNLIFAYYKPTTTTTTTTIIIIIIIPNILTG